MIGIKQLKGNVVWSTVANSLVFRFIQNWEIAVAQTQSNGPFQIRIILYFLCHPIFDLFIFCTMAKKLILLSNVNYFLNCLLERQN